MYVHLIIKILSVAFALCTPLWYDYNDISDIWLPIVMLIGTYLALSVIFWGTIVLFSFTMSKKKTYSDTPGGFCGKLFNLIFDCICSYARIKITVTGKEKVPNEPFMLVCNHRSNFDSMVISAILKKPELIFISKPENFKIIVCGRYMNRCSYLPIDHENIRAAMRTINTSIDLIKTKNASVGIFPEGRRNPPTILGDFSEGCFLMAKKAECPIVVCTISGTDRVHKRFPFRSTQVKLNFIANIPYSEIEDKRTGEISAQIYDMMNNDLFGESEKENEVRTV